MDYKTGNILGIMEIAEQKKMTFCLVVVIFNIWDAFCACNLSIFYYTKSYENMSKASSPTNLNVK